MAMKSLAQISLLPNVRVIEVDVDGGAFFVNDGKKNLKVFASFGEGWDHVSVSLSMRCPTWEEMEFVKRLFFKDDEDAYQLHVAPKDHISIHPYVLHMWRPQDVAIPLPPPVMV